MKTPRYAVILLLAGLTQVSCQRLPVPSPYFSMSRGELDGVLARFPKEVRENVHGDPKGFLSLMKDVLKGPQDLLTVVDKTHGLGEAAPSDLVALSSYPIAVNKTWMSLRQVVIPDLLEMSGAASSDGITLIVSSAYRSYKDQESLWANELQTLPRDQVERELAPPGFSQHQLGTVVDFAPIDVSFADTPAGLWLVSDSWRYGFTLSYPEGGEQYTGYIYEPWHFRWMGRPAAGIIHAFFRDNQKGFLDFYAANADFFRKRMK